MHLVAITQIVRQATFAAIVFLFVDGPTNLFVVGLAEVVAVAFSAALSIILYRSVVHTTGRLRPALSLETFRSGGTIGLSQLFWVVKMFGATVIVGMIATPTETGTFAAAMRIFIAVHTFVWLYFFNLLPSLSRAWINDRASYALLIRNSMRLVFWVAIPACVIALFTAPYAMSLAYGPEFVGGSGPLRWLAVACMIAAVSGHYRFGLIAAGFQSREMLSSAAGAIAAVVLIPTGYFFGGITYAALGLCCAEAVIFAASWLQARHIVDETDRQIVRQADYSVTAG
jgi:O-antigen/teichoic acid export membrane protein